MAKRVLVAIDGSKQAENALEHAFQEFADADLVLLNVIDPAHAGYGAQAGIPSFSEEWYEEAEEQAENLFDDAREQAETRGFAGDIETATDVGRPAHTIVDYVEEHDIDHVVMGSHGRSGLSRVLLGSVAEAVVRRCPVPVTVVR